MPTPTKEQLETTDFRRIIREALTRPIPAEYHSWALDLLRQGYTVTVETDQIWALPPDGQGKPVGPIQWSNLDIQGPTNVTLFPPSIDIPEQWHQRFKIDGALRLSEEDKQLFWKLAREIKEDIRLNPDYWRSEHERPSTSYTEEENERTRKYVDAFRPRNSPDDFDPLTPRPWKWEK